MQASGRQPRCHDLIEHQHDAVPIRLLARTTGSIVFLRRDDRPYDADDVAVAEELGDRAGRALDNARLHGEVARMADHEQRHAAELEAAIGALGEGILVTDPDGSIRIANDAAVRLLGGPASTVDEVLDRLIDSGSFLELGSIAGKATYDSAAKVMTDFMPANGVFGRATIDGRPE